MHSSARIRGCRSFEARRTTTQRGISWSVPSPSRRTGVRSCSHPPRHFVLHLSSSAAAASAYIEKSPIAEAPDALCWFYVKQGYLPPTSQTACVDAAWGETTTPGRPSQTSSSASTMRLDSEGLKKEKVIALSSAEAEYFALSGCVKTVSCLPRLYWKVSLKYQWVRDVAWSSTVISMDSTAAMSFATNARVTARNKHIDVKCHHVRELLTAGVVRSRFVRSDFQPADSLTKIVPFFDLSRPSSLRSMPSD